MRLHLTLGTIVLASTVALASVSCGRSALAPSSHGSRHDQHGVASADHAMMMNLGPKDEEFDLRFLDGMMLHHEGALTMGEAALAASQRPEIKQLAQNILATQQTEIDQMKQWRQQWYPDAGADPIMHHSEMGHSMVMSSEMQAAMRMDADLGKADADFDRRFLDAMIPHHEGALMMADQVLANTERPELRQLAEDILRTQQAEIDQMKEWRQTWYQP